VDLVSGLSPTVAIEQRISHTSRRSTVATLTEIYHFLRLLFSKLGTRTARAAAGPLTRQSAAELQEQIGAATAAVRPCCWPPRWPAAKGFTRMCWPGRSSWASTGRASTARLVPEPGMALSRYHDHTIEVVVGKCPRGRKGASQRLATLVDRPARRATAADRPGPRNGREEVFSVHGRCPTCGIGAVQGDPRLFSFNSPQGACAAATAGVVGVDEFEQRRQIARFCPQQRQPPETGRPGRQGAGPHHLGPGATAGRSAAGPLGSPGLPRSPAPAGRADRDRTDARAWPDEPPGVWATSSLSRRATPCPAAKPSGCAWRPSWAPT
jgi:hypothetical protein